MEQVINTMCKALDAMLIVVYYVIFGVPAFVRWTYSGKSFKAEMQEYLD